MKPGYSRLLLVENLLSLESTLFAASTDLSMMAVNSGRERTEDDWHSVLDAASLHLVKIHRSSGIDEGVIEAEI